jgi:hypothetical protein
MSLTGILHTFWVTSISMLLMLGSNDVLFASGAPLCLRGSDG